ncbi:MAG TPA: hypothetical protein VFL16_11900 [Steroidobacteraceae bacterium]|nr:hypothetical protein [Steroidobacteraceae bacterium]
MFPTIRNSPPSAAQSCGQIELVPSRRAAALATAWLLAVSAAVLGGVALPLPARITICVVILVSGLAGIRSGFLLEGRRTLVRLCWDADSFVVQRRCDRIELSATLARGSFRLGQWGLFLWFSTCEGRHGAFIDADRHDSHELRRLCARLSWRPRPGPDERQTTS